MIAASSISDADSAERLRVLLADDHPAMLARTTAALAGDVCSSVQWAMDAHSSLRRSGSILMSSCSTSPCRGSTGSKPRQLRRSHHPARLVFLTVHEDIYFARAALDAGALGYVVKARLASDLLPAIRAALADRRFISPTLRFDEAN